MDFGAGDLPASVSQTKTNTVLRYYCKKNNGNIMKCPSCDHDFTMNDFSRVSISQYYVVPRFFKTTKK